MTLSGVDVARRGHALRVRLTDGTARIVRQKDLAEVLGEFRSSHARQFADASLADGGVDVTYADGASEHIPARLLAGSADRARVDLVIENTSFAMTCDDGEDGALGLVRDGAVVVGGGRVRWVGPRDRLATCGLELRRAHRLDAGGRLVTPGLVDPHAHPMFAGNRADEFGLRAAGAGYQEIAAAGGGIAATMIPTREASFDDHVKLTSRRMACALALGTTTCEAKSGYDLTVEGELRLLEVALVVDATQPVDLVPTLLGAHVLPPDRAGDRAGYVADVADRMVPAAAERELARSVDVYCDEGAFTLAETERILRAAVAAGLGVRAHVGQFADLGGAELLAELGALSADHLENVSDAGIACLARHEVIAVMLPGACVQLRMAPPPVARLREAGVAMALGSDLNPGTSHTESLPIQMWLATTHYGMTVDEAWLGVTRHAARAIGRHDVGCLSPDALADLVVWDAETPADIPYHYGVNLARHVIKAGRICTP